MPRTKGSGNRIQCAFGDSGEIQGAPDNIVYMPEGDHEIHATVNGKPKTISVSVTKEVLAAFQAGLEERLARKGARPNLDFDHAGKGKASALPKRFRYEEGRGLILDIEWTSAGRTAIEGKDYSYFSPDFLLGADGVPTGIPMRGPIGSLVNDPAFETIERIAASNADGAVTQPTEDMSILNDIGLLSENEAAKEDASKVAAARIKALKDEPSTVAAAAVKELQGTITDALTAIDGNAEDVGVSAALADDATISTVGKALGSLIVACAQNVKDAAEAKIAAAKATAQASVDALVAAGKVPAKSEDLKEFWLKQFIDNPEGAEAISASLPKIAPGITEKEVTATAPAGGSDVDKACAEVVAAGRAKTNAEALPIVFSESPELYESYQTENGLAH